MAASATHPRNRSDTVNAPSSKPEFCGCKMIGTRWASPCKSHEAQYDRLVAMARVNYEAFRRQAEMPAPKEVSP